MRKYFELGLVCLSGLGLALNLLVLYMATWSSHALAIDTVAMMLVAVLDLVACLFIAVAQTMRWCGVQVPCMVDLMVFATASFGSLGMTAVLSGVRYASIVRGWQLDTRNGILGCLVVLGMIWMVVVSRGLLFRMEVMPSGFYCMPIPEYGNDWYVLLDVIYNSLLFPCPVVIVVCYVLVTCHYCTLARHDGSSAFPQPMTWSKQLAFYYRRITYKLVLIVVAYSISIFPEYFLSFLSLITQFQRTYTQDVIAFLLIFSLSIINPFFILHLHKGSRSKAHRIMKNLPATPSASEGSLPNLC
ncbi:hypothetical protein DSO57_1027435 [Entomophthora muscae]|uniref:Uncharacterized protein n=1 Tax=Entomophthora muscae TaxID=34485 RepID=A0ACC2UM96_9FUNG|nr:hypothetical protein DSO57_1027435 [Entomophthora muscae]